MPSPKSNASGTQLLQVCCKYAASFCNFLQQIFYRMQISFQAHPMLQTCGILFWHIFLAQCAANFWHISRTLRSATCTCSTSCRSLSHANIPLKLFFPLFLHTLCAYISMHNRIFDWYLNEHNCSFEFVKFSKCHGDAHIKDKQVLYIHNIVLDLLKWTIQHLLKWVIKVTLQKKRTILRQNDIQKT